jgi:hypothetical protein
MADKPGQVEQSVIYLRSSRYHEAYARWRRDTEGFWGEAAQEIDWIDSDQKALWRWQREWLRPTAKPRFRSTRREEITTALHYKAGTDVGSCRMKVPKTAAIFERPLRNLIAAR